MKLKKTILMLLMSSTALISTAQVNPFTDPNNTGNWVLNNQISDEFEGNSLDESKWIIQGKGGHFENNFKGRAPSQFAPGNISVAGGKMTITSKWQPNYNFANETFGGYRYENITAGAIISKNKFKYGYMEIKCIAADGPISSSFWSTGTGGEIDVFEHYGNNPNKPNSGKKYHTSFHDWRTPGTPTYGKRIWTNEHILPFRVASEEHVYGMEWDANFLKIYVDNILVKCVTRAEIGDRWVATNEQKVWVDSETFPWEGNPANLTASDFPGTGRKFIVEYVRIWQKSGSSPGCQNQTNLVANSGFENNLNSWTTTGNPRVVNNANASYDGSKHISIPAGSVSTIQQNVTVKPNTVYILRAWGKAPLSDFSAGIFHDGYMGVKNYGGPEEKIAFFAPDWHTKSIQFKTGASTTQATIYYTNEGSSEPTIVDNITLEEAKITGTSNPNPTTPSTGGINCSSIPVWRKSNTFTIGDRVKRSNVVYQLRRGAGKCIPGGSSDCSRNQWNKVGDCGSSKSISAKDLNVKLYPNPAVNQVNITSSAGASISIIDLNGKVILTQIAQGEITVFNLNGVTKGMYLVKIEVKGGIVCEKLVVN